MEYKLKRDFDHPVYPFKAGAIKEALGWTAIFMTGYYETNPTESEKIWAEQFCLTYNDWFEQVREKEIILTISTNNYQGITSN